MWTSRPFSTASKNLRKMIMRENAVLETLRKRVSDPLSGADLVTLGRVRDVVISPCLSEVKCKIQTPSPILKEMNSQWVDEAKKSLLALDWVKEANVEIEPMKSRRSPSVAARHTTLANVQNIIAVSSCKGGVGKSTVAVNLAASLQKLGAQVGLLDADIYGPSLPTMITPSDLRVQPSTKTKGFIQPIKYNGMNCMSFGFVNTKAAPGAGGSGAAVMRGPMVSKIIDQLILGTEWGSLDYLVVDLPPGTGDIQMSLSQQMAISMAVIVTTPQKLSFVDVDKGIDMFHNLKIPTAAIVQNMAYFDCIHGHRHYPFGQSNRLAELSKKWQINTTFALPITADLSQSGDTGQPLAFHPDRNPDVLKVYEQLATCVAKECIKSRYTSKFDPELLFDKTRNLMLIRTFSLDSAAEFQISPTELRANCRCAKCVDEFTGKKLIQAEDIPTDIKPTNVVQKGNYSYAVTWSDGHSSSLYTFDHLKSLAQQ